MVNNNDRVAWVGEKLIRTILVAVGLEVSETRCDTRDYQIPFKDQ